eukprot:1701258-Rhodomonas_salina.1
MAVCVVTTISGIHAAKTHRFTLNSRKHAALVRTECTEVPDLRRRTIAPVSTARVGPYYGGPAVSVGHGEIDPVKVRAGRGTEGAVERSSGAYLAVGSSAGFAADLGQRGHVRRGPGSGAEGRGSTKPVRAKV